MEFALIGIALVPTIIIFSIVIKKASGIKKEPFKNIAKVFMISVASTIAAIIFSSIGNLIQRLICYANGLEKESIMGMLVYCLLFVAFVEESCKYFSFKFTIFNDRQFDHTYDGVVYGAAAALGFATFENIFYVLMHGFITGIFRAIMSVPLHAFTGIYMGYYFGISKYKKYNNIEHDKNPQRRAFIFSLLVHGLYDFFLFAVNAKDAPRYFVWITIVGVIGIMIVVYIMMKKTINKAVTEDLMIYNAYYYEHLNGQYQDFVGKTKDKAIVFAGVSNNVPNNTSRYITPGDNTYRQLINGQYSHPMNNYNAQPVGNTNGYLSTFGQYTGQNSSNFIPNASDTYNSPTNPQYGHQTSDNYQQPVNNMYIQNGKINTDMIQQREKIYFCNECGYKLSNDSYYCPVCGNKT